jgi:hypothetical protein
MGKIGAQQEKIIARRDPAARPALEGAGQITAPAPAAPREQPGSALRERLAHARALNEERPLPAGTGALPAVPGVPPEVVPVLIRLLSEPGGTTSQQAGLAIGRSKSVAHDYLAVLREQGVAEMTGGGRGSRFRLIRPAPPAVPEPPAYTTIAHLAEAVHDGLVPGVTEEQREVLEQVWQIAHRPRLTVVHGGSGGSP